MKHISRLRYILALVVSLIFVGCSSSGSRMVSHTSMGRIEMGMSPLEVDTTTGATALPLFKFEMEEKNWQANYYLHSAGLNASRYLALFDNSGLRFWGFIHEFERQRDASIVAAARMAEIKYTIWAAEQAALSSSSGGHHDEL